MEDSQLFALIKEKALLRGEFTLRSGRKSNYYLDKYLFESEPAILRELAQRFAVHVGRQTDRIAGAELGGVALAAATALAAERPFVIIRNSAKGYGTQKMFEGRLNAGERILLLEDIATTGGQVLDAARIISEAGCTVEKIVAVIDRLEGARANIESAGYRFESLLTKGDLGI